MDIARIAFVLCDKCSSLDIDAALSSTPDSRRVNVLLELGSSKVRNDDSYCPLCRLMSAFRPITNEASNSDNLLLVSLVFKHRGFDPIGDYLALGVIPKSNTRGKISAPRAQALLHRTGYLATTTPPRNNGQRKVTIGRDIGTNITNYTILRNWLHHCQSRHRGCKLKAAFPWPEDLTLINCDSGRLERASTRCSYFALSYVWGQDNRREAAMPLVGDSLPNLLPRTVEDAIIVTKSMGYEYLWVDKYCINQSDSEEKLHQIQQMDLVYLNAEMTIVAGYGDHADCGLPGVSSVRRTPQPKAQVGSHLLVALLPEPTSLIKDSPWMSRGWTFQEALLSRRLMIFTEHQVYFECKSTNFCETVDVVKDWAGLNYFFSMDEERGWPWHILVRIHEYSSRELSYPEDVLHAFLGILKAYQRSKYPIYHHLGVPILPAVVKHNNGWPRKIDRDHREGFLCGLCWQPLAPGKRRCGFPSWSWTGWSNLISKKSQEYEHGLRLQSQTNIEVFIEDQQQTLLPWDDFWSLMRDDTVFSHYLWLVAYTIPLKFTFDPNSADTTKDMPTKGSLYWTTFDLDEQYCVQAQLFLLPDTETGPEYHLSLTTKTFLGVILGESHHFTENPHTFVMVVEDKGDYFERIGHIIHCAMYIRMFDKTTQLEQAYDLQPDHTTMNAFFRYQELRKIRIG